MPVSVKPVPSFWGGVHTWWLPPLAPSSWSCWALSRCDVNGGDNSNQNVVDDFFLTLISSLIISPNVSFQFQIDLSSQLLTRASQSSARHLDRSFAAELPATISLLYIFNLVHMVWWIFKKHDGLSKSIMNYQEVWWIVKRHYEFSRSIMFCQKVWWIAKQYDGLSRRIMDCE